MSRMLRIRNIDFEQHMILNNLYNYSTIYRHPLIVKATNDKKLFYCYIKIRSTYCTCTKCTCILIELKLWLFRRIISQKSIQKRIIPQSLSLVIVKKTIWMKCRFTGRAIIYSFRGAQLASPSSFWSIPLDDVLIIKQGLLRKMSLHIFWEKSHYHAPSKF